VEPNTSLVKEISEKALAALGNKAKE